MLQEVDSNYSRLIHLVCIVTNFITSSLFFCLVLVLNCLNFILMLYLMPFNRAVINLFPNSHVVHSLTASIVHLAGLILGRS